MRQRRRRSRRGSDAVSRLRRAGTTVNHAGTAILACFACGLMGAASPGHAADAALYQAARKEGQVVWYTALIVTQAVRPLIAAFKLKDPNGRWNALVLYFLTPAINTNLVSEQDRPRTPQELLDPRWKGRIAWSTAPSSGSPVYVGAVLATMGEQKGMDFLRALSKQNIVNVDATNRAILDQVILGEYAISLNAFNHHAVLSARKGAPVA